MLCSIFALATVRNLMGAWIPRGIRWGGVWQPTSSSRRSCMKGEDVSRTSPIRRRIQSRNRVSSWLVCVPSLQVVARLVEMSRCNMTQHTYPRKHRRLMTKWRIWKCAPSNYSHFISLLYPFWLKSIESSKNMTSSLTYSQERKSLGRSPVKPRGLSSAICGYVYISEWRLSTMGLPHI